MRYVVFAWPIVLVITAGVALYLLSRIVKEKERRRRDGSEFAATVHALEERVAGLEEGQAGVSEELERISEAQQFIERVIAQKAVADRTRSGGNQ